MLPSTLLGLLLFLASVSPGYIYLRTYERRSFRDARTGLREVAEIVTVGALATTVASFVMLTVGQLTTAFLPLSGLLEGSRYLREHPWQVIASAGSVLGLSLQGCALVGSKLGGRAGGPTARTTMGTVWGSALRQPVGFGERRPFATIETTNDTHIDGFILSVSHAIDPAQREIALRAPIGLSLPGGVQQRLDAHIVIVPGTMIRTVSVRWMTPQSRKTDDSSA